MATTQTSKNSSKNSEPIDLDNLDELAENVVDLEAPAADTSRAPAEAKEPETNGSNGRRRRTRPRASNAAAPRRVSGTLAQILPESEKLGIYRVNAGQRAFIGYFSPKLIAKAGSVEIFIQQKLMPKHGDGDYEVDAFDVNGRLVRSAPVSVLDPEGPKRDDTTAKVVIEAAQRREERLQQRLDELQAAQAKQPSLAEQLQQFAVLKKELFGDEQRTDPAAMAMIMQMMKPPDNSAMITALQRELEDLRRVQNQAPAAPLNIPPPSNGAKDIVEAVMHLAPVLKGIFERPPQPTFVEQMQQFMVMKEALGIQPPPPPKSLAEQAADFAAVRGMFGENEATGGLKGALKAHAEIEKIKGDQGGGDSMWEFFNNLVNRGPELIEAIRAKAEERKAVEERRQLPEGSAPAAQLQESNIEAPPAFGEKMREAEEAAEPLERVMKTAEAIMILWSAPAFRGFAKTVMEAVKAGDKDRSMELLGKLLSESKADGLITQAGETAIIEAFDEHFEVVVEAVREKMPG